MDIGRPALARLLPHPAAFAAVSGLLMLILTACADHSQPGDIAQIEHMCSSCHGVNGYSTSPTFPRLAGQQPDYLVNELKSFRDHSRAERDAHTYMWGMALRLDDQSIVLLAAFYARQPPMAGAGGDENRMEAGRRLYRLGNPTTGGPACLSCHGERAEGAPARGDLPSTPRLVGQHRDYLALQLKIFAANARANRTMHDNAVALSAEQIDLLADYLSSQ